MATARAKANYERFLQYNVNVGYGITNKEFVWVKDADKKGEGYLKGEVVSKEPGKKLKVKYGDGSSVVVNEADTEPANPAKFDGAKDCAELSHLNNATVLHNLRVRYAEDLIHTYSGLFLVVVNPYKWIPIYTDEIIQIYQGKRRNEVFPHVFAVGDEAYRAMVNGRKNQSILITGESGAGKTENTKKVIQYLATIAGKASSGGKLEEQILQLNPLMEAFGNAKTNKNDNSSRFGKFIRVQFNSGGMICGTTIQVYLLEKSRVVFQGPNERTFHIFYQLLSGADSIQRKTYHLQKPTEYGFFTDKNAIILKSMDDGAEWGHTLKAMEVIGLTKEEQDDVFRLVAGIMQAGNLKYGSSYGGEGAKIENPEVLDKICELWGMDKEVFEKALIRPRVTAGKDTVEKHLSKVEASYAREAMCKSVYERCFLWLVKKLNRVLASATEANFIGVLDIAGFEIFEHNSFEQLCINFTNEKLQQFFNNHMFKLEQEEYGREKIEWTYIDFGLDSQQRIELIEKKDNSIIALLDEETIFPRATDETLIMKLHTLAKKHTYYSEVQFKKLNFQIQHYAGDVLYDVKDWITKNKDPLQDDIAKCIIAAKRPFFSALFTDPDLDPRERLQQQKAAAAEAAGKKKAVTTSGATFLTVASAYKDQLADLMDTLRATEPNFIRCLIPNLQKRQQHLNADLILEQLACNGVLEGIRISRKGYPNRTTYPEFVRRYYLLHDSMKRDDPESKTGTQKIMEKLSRDLEKAFAEGDHPKPLWQFGLTKIFFRHGVLAKIEEIREKKLSQMVIAIQAAARGWLGRSAFRKHGMQSSASKIVQKNVKCWIKFKQWNWWQLFAKSKPLLNKVGIEVVIKELEEKIEQCEKDLKTGKSDREKLHGDYGEKKEHLLRLREDLASLNGRLGRLESEKDNLTKENASLTSDVANLEAKFASLTKGRNATDKDLQDAEADLDDKTAMLKKEEALVKNLVSLKEENLAQLKELANKQSDLEDSNSHLRNNISNQQEVLDKASKDLDNRELDGSNLKKKMAQLQSELEDANATNASDKTDRVKIQDTIKGLQTQIADTEDELDATKKQLAAAKAAVKTLEGEQKDLEADLDRTDRQISDLEKKKARLSEELNIAQDGIASEKAGADAANKKNSALSSEISTLEGEVKDLESKRDQLESAKKGLSSNMSDQQAKLAGLKSNAEKLKKQLQEAESALKEKEAALDAADASNDNAKKANAKLDGQLKDVQDELATEAEANSKKTKDNQAREGDLRSAEQKIKDAESSVAALQAEEKKLKGDKNSAEASSGSRKTEVADLERKVKGVKGQVEDIKRDLVAEEEERSKAEKGKKAAQLQLAEAEAERKELEKEQESLKAKLKAKAAEADDLSSRVASDELEKEKATWKAEKKKVQQELDEVRGKLDAAENKRNRAARKIKKLQAQLADLKEENKQKEAQNSKGRGAANVEEETRKCNSELKKDQEDLDRDEKELKNLQAELEALRDLIKKAVTTSGEETIKSIDGRTKAPSKSSGESGSASPFISRQGSRQSVAGDKEKGSRYGGY